MSRLVLDTNALIQCLPNKSRYRCIWNSILDGRNTLCISNGILEEYEEVLGRMYGSRIADFAILSIVNKHTDFPPVNLIGLDDFLEILKSSSQAT